ncbi:S41 family peptidase [Nonomuraea sp. NPDC050536]|uniref:S41 family peptidase n=1 Tax=Nonomuraea sp. NPDC050536 TaxID=3364366 RepID=UPI0037CB0323
MKTALVGLAAALALTGFASAPAAASKAAACAPATQPPPPVQPTTIATIEQAYRCIFDHYYGGDRLDDRTLLTGAFAGLTQELQRRGLDQADATLPPLSGDRDRDWEAFRAVYERVSGEVPDKPEVEQALAGATMTAMIGTLQDNHARWMRPEVPPGAKPGDAYGLGITGLSGRQGSRPDPAATGPLFVTSIAAGSPAAQRGLKPGDVIISANGSAPFAGGVLSTGVLNLLDPQYPDQEPVRLTLRRPATGRTWTTTVKPGLYRTAPPAVSSKTLPGDIAYVALPGFFQGAADQVLARLREQPEARGVVLDLRGNRGGSDAEVNRLLGAFVHGKVTAYHCDAQGSCTAGRTDDSVPLLGLPLVTLTDRVCGSACDHFTSAVKDLKVGPLVGTRTGGVVSGPASAYTLSDNSALLLPTLHHLGPNREIVNGIGVAPDHYRPLTARDLSTGKDPALEKALDILTSSTSTSTSTSVKPTPSASPTS